MVVLSMFQGEVKNPKTLEYLSFKDKNLEEKYRNSSIPADTLHELYIKGDVSFKKDMLDSFTHRHEFMNFKLTTNHVKFFLNMLIPEGLNHSKKMDQEEIAPNYNRGSIFLFCL